MVHLATVMAWMVGGRDGYDSGDNSEKVLHHCCLGLAIMWYRVNRCLFFFLLYAETISPGTDEGGQRPNEAAEIFVPKSTPYSTKFFLRKKPAFHLLRQHQRLTNNISRHIPLNVSILDSGPPTRIVLLRVRTYAVPEKQLVYGLQVFDAKSPDGTALVFNRDIA